MEIVREIKRCPTQSVMGTVTAFLEEQGDKGKAFWSHLQNLNVDRCPADLRATLHCRRELLEALGRSIEMRIECVLSSGFVYAAGSSGTKFLP